ncbi:MAG: choice-of-anchor D domain-containing protein, partial [Calditrichaeota bacterium]|nr:choice-of-anchor D domain-containing protein [Calditrichota bacterium]
DEDFDRYEVADLDEVFYDPDEDELDYIAESSNENLIVEIDEANRLWLSAVENWFGEAVITVWADDGYEQERNQGPVRSHLFDIANIPVGQNIDLDKSNKPVRQLRTIGSSNIPVGGILREADKNACPTINLGSADNLSAFRRIPVGGASVPISQNIDLIDADTSVNQLNPRRDDITETGFSVTIHPVNDAPTWTETPDEEITVTEGDLIEFNLAGEDVDDEELTITAELPEGAELEDDGEGNAFFRWQTYHDDGGEYSITFTLSDGNGSVDFEVTITIEEDHVLNVPDEYETIQGAIDVSSDGDTVLVDPGEYVENIDFIGKDIVVASLFLIDGDEDYIEQTIIDGDENGSVVFFHNGETEDAILSGFTIQNGTGYPGGHDNFRYGGGIYIRNCGPTILNCHIVNNSANMGGGIGTEYDGANPTIGNCVVRDNTGNYAAGIAIDWFSSAVIENSEIMDNEGTGLYGWNAGVVLSNCLISGNRTVNPGPAINCYNNTSIDVTNCTIVGNSAEDNSSGGIRTTRSSLRIVNSILWDNSPREIAFAESGNNVTVSYSDVEGGEDGVEINDAGNLTWNDGNIDEDPLFADPDEGDFHLTEDSPCIDTGDPDSDNDPDDTRADMGAYYFHQEAVPDIAVEPEALNFGEVITSRTVEEILTISNGGSADLTVTGISIDGDGFSVDFEDEFVIEPEDSCELVVSFAPEEEGDYEGTLTITSDDPDEGELEVHLSGAGVESHIFEVGYYDTHGNAYDVAVSRDYAYVTDGSNGGLQIINVSDPENPDRTGSYNTGQAKDIVVIGELVYLADYNRGFRIIDVSDRENPEQVGFTNEIRYAYGVHVVGNYAYVGGWSRRYGLFVVNISDPENPEVVGICDIPGRARGVTVYGDYAYVADYSEGLRIIDISDPEHPEEVGFYDTPGWALETLYRNDCLFLADGGNGLLIFDVSNPEEPEIIGHCDTPDYAFDLAIVRNYCFVADYYSGLQVIDISDPENPEIVDSHDTRGISNGVAVVGDYAYIADYYSGLLILNVAYYTHPSPIADASPRRLDFGEVSTTQSEEGTIILANLGSGDLDVTDISIEGDNFSVEFDNAFAIEPDDEYEITILFEPDEEEEFEALLTILSDDPNEPVMVIPLSGIGVSGEIEWTEHVIEGDFSGAVSVYAEDIDGDGDMDVLGAAINADDITWWENDGEQDFTEHT